MVPRKKHIMEVLLGLSSKASVGNILNEHLMRAFDIGRAGILEC